jgi:hypothetical protein
MICINRRTALRLSHVSIVALALVAQLGCGQKGVDRYELSGKVTYLGQPVPAGYLVLKPDAAKGNIGPGAAADIRNGQYVTTEGRGTIGGPHVVTIFGFDGKAFTMEGGISNPMGKPLCRTDIDADLPKANGTHDFVAAEQRK